MMLTGSLTLALVAAAASPVPVPAPVRPDLSIVFEHFDGDLLVHLDLAGDADGETVFTCAESWGGVEPGGTDLSELEARGSRSGELEVTRSAPHRWHLSHAPGETLSMTYTIAANEHRANDDPRVHYRPCVSEDLVHLIGNLALLVPDDRDWKAPIDVELAWEGFDEDGWDVACSFAAGPGPHSFRTTLNELQNSVFVGGDLAVLEREVHGKPVFVAISGDRWRFESDAFADLAASVVQFERAFFEDYTKPYYIVTLLDVGARVPGRESMGGTGLTNSFCLFLQPFASIEPGSEERERITWLLAHEMFHEWNGRAIGRAEEALNYWFSEGFTDFYARRLLYRAGLIDAERYAASLNETIAEYWANPERDAPNARIGEAFWRGRNVQRLPYQRGDLIALRLDHAIRARSGGERSLDDLMRELVGGRVRISNEDMLARIAALVSPEDAADLRRAILAGGPIALPEDVLGPCLRVVEETATGFELGFDREASLEDNVVVGVIEGSAAHRAGLRDGQRLDGNASITWGKKDVPVRLDVRNGAGERLQLTWMPEGGPTLRPRFTVVDPAGCACL